MKFPHVCLRDSYRRFTQCGKPPKNEFLMCQEEPQFFARLPLLSAQGFRLWCGQAEQIFCNFDALEASIITHPGVANLACSVAMAISQLATSWHPAAVAKPRTSAITGTSISWGENKKHYCQDMTQARGSTLYHNELASFSVRNEGASSDATWCDLQVSLHCDPETPWLVSVATTKPALSC